MKVKTVVVGPIDENCHIVFDGGEALVIDPGDELERILAAIGDAHVVGIVATHRHWDHIGALAGLARECGAPVLASAGDAVAVCSEKLQKARMVGRGAWRDLERHVDRELSEGDAVRVGACTFTVIETPGHTVGSICLHCPEEHALFAGDTVFSGGRFGRTDFATGDMQAMKGSLRKLAVLADDETVVYCGHDARTTMGRERALNPYMRV